MKAQEKIPRTVAKAGSASARVPVSNPRPVRRSRQDEADLAVSDGLIRAEKPVPLKRILRESGR